MNEKMVLVVLNSDAILENYIIKSETHNSLDKVVVKDK